MIITMVLWLLAGHQQTVYVLPNHPVSVVTCKKKVPIVLYGDANMTTPIPNPMMPDQYGKLQFWIGKSGCVEVTPISLPNEK